MNKKIFLSSCLVAFTVLIISLAMSTGVLFNQFEKQVEQELKEESELIASVVEDAGVENIADYDFGSRRVTVIGKDGGVIFDSQADASKMENHADREEFKEAVLYGTGMSSRYSDTLTQKNIYYALKLSDGSVLRLSSPHSTIFAIISDLIGPICLIVLLALILSAILAIKLSESILKPINALDLDNPENNKTYDELAPLLTKINRQKLVIENQLHEAKQKQKEFKLITDNMREGLLVIDSNSDILTYNAAAEKLLDITDETSLAALKIYRSTQVIDAVDEALKGNNSECQITQHSRQYSLIANPVFRDGEIIGAVIVLLDITEKAQREQLRREFTANVSHELKTPLTSIYGFAELMKDGDMKKEDMEDFAKSIYDETKHLITLVGDIIKLSALDEKSRFYEKEKVDLYALACETAERLKVDAAKKHVTVNVEGEKAEYVGVRQILTDIIYNLCENAIKYNRENGSVHISVKENENNIVLKVKDTGIGIPQEHQERVFERFYRVDKSHSKEIGGTGLGLSIVKHGVMYHGGEISMESEPGKGTEITVTFKKNNDNQ